MTVLDAYGFAAAMAVFLAFYFVRNVSTYIKICAAIVLGVALATVFSGGADRLVEGAMLVAGVGLFAFGLLFVRVMFIRSVSLNMLRGIQAGSVAGFGEDIGGRLRDMRTFRLIRSTGDTTGPAQGPGDELNALSASGRFVSTVTVVLYTLLRVKI